MLPVSVIAEPTIFDLVNVALKTPEGCFVEVGVYKGGSAYYLSEAAQSQNRQIFLYDTFTGIPYSDSQNGDHHLVGDFSDTTYEEVVQAIPYASVIKGIFPESAVLMPNVAFAHLDCDQYRSYVDSITYLVPFMVKGGIMWFDDYSFLDGATKAIDEIFGNRVELAFGKALVRF